MRMYRPPGVDHERDRLIASVPRQCEFTRNHRWLDLLGSSRSGPHNRAVENGLHADIGLTVPDQPVDRPPSRRKLRPMTLRTDGHSARDIRRHDGPQEAVTKIVLDPDRVAI